MVKTPPLRPISWLFSLQSSRKVVFLQDKFVTANGPDTKTQRTPAGAHTTGLQGSCPPRVSPLLPRLMSGELKINEVEPQLL